MDQKTGSNDIRLSDPDWQEWLKKVGTFRDEYYTTVEWGKPPEGMKGWVLPKDRKTWSGTATLYETETDLGFAPGVTLPEDFPWKCESQKVKVTLELVE